MLKTHHSTTLETCMAQVGKDSALAGSLSWPSKGNSAAEAGSSAVRAKPAPRRPTTPNLPSFWVTGWVWRVASVGAGGGEREEKMVCLDLRGKSGFGENNDKVFAVVVAIVFFFVAGSLRFFWCCYFERHVIYVPVMILGLAVAMEDRSCQRLRPLRLFPYYFHFLNFFLYSR